MVHDMDVEETVQPVRRPVVKEKASILPSYVASDGSFTKRILQSGIGLKSPTEGSVCYLKVEFQDDTQDISIYSSVLEQCGIAIALDKRYTIGNQFLDFHEVFDAAVCTMKPGEVSSVEFNFKDGLECTNKVMYLCVTLHSYEVTKDIWHMTAIEKLDKAKHFKSIGVDYFKNQETTPAFKAFSRALKYTICIGKKDDVNLNELSLIKCACYLNLSACQLKTQNYKHVITNCTKGLAIEPDNVKALYRRAQAYFHSNEFLLAKTGLNTILDREPSNKAARDMLQSIKNKESIFNSSMATAMKKMFS